MINSMKKIKFRNSLKFCSTICFSNIGCIDDLECKINSLKIKII